jgi:predicted ATPase/class 3 adenylate cyclase
VVQAPTGTLTFLFTDIEGSTRLWEREPEAMRDALARHDAIMRSAIERHGGCVFATGGDGFAVAFGRAADAVNTAVEAQRALCGEDWPGDARLRVRMAAHSGEVVERDGDYFGPAANRAARLLDLAAGGQVVCSHVVGALCGRLPEIEFVDAGDHELRGVTEPMSVYVIASGGLADLALPVPAPLGGNLARPATEFVGRVSELERLADTLVQSRLLTLTGTGGVGKTRLAVELAWRMADEFPDGVWLVELGAVTEPEAVPHAIATALSARPQPGVRLEDAIIDLIAPRTCLVVLDNCEHVVDAVEKLVTRIMRECSEVTLLATSREPIDVAEEHVWRVRSLDAVEAPSSSRRARSTPTRPRRSTTRNAQPSPRSVSGSMAFPLAIELAAARMRSMTTAELFSRLDDRFRLLRGSRRGGVERHQTLRAAVTWSYQLLTQEEQQLFDQCAVVAGTFDLDAVEAICTTIDAIDELSSLVDKSMIVSERTELGTRYRLLETMRQYGEERLDERGLGAELRDRHLAYYAQRMTQVNEMYYGPRETDAVAIYEHEWDNVRAAVAWAEATDELDQRSALLVATTNFAVNTLRREHYEWTMTTLAATDAPMVELRSNAASLAYFLGDAERAVALARDGIARAEREDDTRTFYAWFGGHFAAFALGDIDEAARMAEGCVASAGSNPAHRARALVCEAQIAIVRDVDALPRINEEIARCADEMQNASGWSFAAGDRGMGQLLQGDREGALATLEEAIAWARKSGSITLLNGWQTALAYALSDAPDDEHTRGTYRRMITQCRADDDWANMWIVLDALSVHLAYNERLEPSAVLISALAQ